jgi:hypothetical protein
MSQASRINYIWINTEFLSHLTTDLSNLKRMGKPGSGKITI